MCVLCLHLCNVYMSLCVYTYVFFVNVCVYVRHWSVVRTSNCSNFLPFPDDFVLTGLYCILCETV